MVLIRIHLSSILKDIPAEISISYASHKSVLMPVRHYACSSGVDEVVQ